MNEQLTLPNPSRNAVGRFHRDGQPTERVAAVLVAPRTGTQRARVLEALRMGGCTDYELWRIHGIGARPHVPGTRREELIADGWPIVATKERRPTDTGAPAIVWTLKEEEAP